MKKSLILWMIVIAFIVPLVNAQTYEAGTNIDLKVPCSNNAQLCSTVAECNITVISPSNALLINNSAMTNALAFFNYTVPSTNTTETGTYESILFCEDGTLNDFTTFQFEVTPTGTVLSTGGSLIYGILGFGVFLLFALAFYFAIVMPYRNNVDEEGYTIKICKLKYVKLGLIQMSWVLFTWFLNILIGLSNNFVSLTMFSGFFSFLFNNMNRLALPFGIFILVLSFFEIIRDANIHENIKKFGSSP